MSPNFAARGLLVACTVFLVACSTGSEEVSGWPVTKVALTTVERSAAPRTFHGVGELEAHRQVELASESAGRITRIGFASGQRVTAGELLVQINDAPEQADRLRLRAQLRNAETVLARTRQLLADRVATQEQFDRAQAERDMARGQLQQIEAVIAQKAVRAPFTGVIGIRLVHEGQYIEAGTAIANLVDASVLNVNFSLAEGATPQLQPNQPVALRVDAWPERRFMAKVAAIDPLISKSRTAQVQASVANADGVLMAGMFAHVQVSRQQPTLVLTVPETAVTYTAYGQTVFVVKPGESQGLSVHRVSVKTGERWNGQVEIASGLHEGDQVVVSGQNRLSDGMPVEPVVPAAKPAAAPSQEHRHDIH